MATRLRESILETTTGTKDGFYMARAQVVRYKGEVGLYVDAYEAIAEDPHEFGSELCYIMELPDKMQEHFAQVPFDVLKGGFERAGIMDGVIVERLHKCNVYSVSFETPESLEQMWRDYEKELIGPVIHATLATSELAASVGAKSLYLRTRIYRDEVDDCRKEIQAQVKAHFDFESDRAFLLKVQDYQQKELVEKIILLREDFSHFEATLGEFTLTIKRNIPVVSTSIDSFAELEAIHQQIKTSKDNNKRKQTKWFDMLYTVRRSLARVLVLIEDNVCHPLAQVHAAHETQTQRENKTAMKTRCRLATARLDPAFNHARLRHVEWVSKIVMKDHKLFLGLVSVVALGIATVVDIDHLIDEYISGFTRFKLSVVKL